MYALDNSSGVKVMPVVNNQLYSPDEPRWFTEGGNGVSPSYPGADWFNIVQAELLGVLTEAHITPDKNNLTQLAQAVKKIITDNTTTFTALHDLFIGVPIPYPLSTVPAGCLAMNGQRFDTHRYPQLAQKYPSGQLPDMRGEFIRGWDNGRGVDVGRSVLATQTDLVGSHKHRFGNYYSQAKQNISKRQGKNFEYDVGTPTGIVNVDSKFKGELYDNFDSIGVALSWGDGGLMYSDRVISMIGDYKETRPRNIAYHYICLAA